jgi:hypothetical protein
VADIGRAAVSRFVAYVDFVDSGARTRQTIQRDRNQPVSHESYCKACIALSEILLLRSSFWAFETLSYLSNAAVAMTLSFLPKLMYGPGFFIYSAAVLINRAATVHFMPVGEFFSGGSVWMPHVFRVSDVLQCTA